MDALKPFLCCPLQWVNGMVFSLGVGWLVVHFFKEFLEYCIGLPEETNVTGLWNEEKKISVPADITGIIERAFFTIWVGYMDLDTGIAAGIFGWLGLKLASNWHRRDPRIEKHAIARTWVALLSGLVSVMWAIGAGLYIWHAAVWGPMDSFE